MISLRTGASPQSLQDILKNAALGLENVQGEHAIDLYNRYLEWAAEQIRFVSNVVGEDELERLIISKRYLTLLSLDPAGVSPLTLRSLVSGEIEARKRQIQYAQEQLTTDIERWGRGTGIAVVWDTSVWLKHFEGVAGFDWIGTLNERTNVPLVLTVPMRVVDELDGHKRNRQNPPRGGLPIRKRAAMALKFLESNAHTPGHRTPLREGEILGESPHSPLHLSVLPQSLERPQLPDSDLEIIDRARAIEPYAKRVYLVTTDYGMVYRARQAGLDSIRVPDYEEERDD